MNDAAIVPLALIVLVAAVAGIHLLMGKDQ